MKNQKFSRRILQLMMLALLTLPELASAQFFSYNEYGDVLAGFRKTGVNAGNYELVVDLGSVTNLLKLPIGTTTNITRFSPSQLTDAFPNGYGNLQWSAFSYFTGNSSWVTPLGSFPKDTLWYTVPGTNINTQTQPPYRNSYQAQQATKSAIAGAGNGATAISQELGVTNADNNTFLVREPVALDVIHLLTTAIGDSTDSTIGDFGSGGSPLAQPVENTTPNSFTAAQRSDFYQVCPFNEIDPITGLTNKTPYFVGYFILNPNGTMTFTRAAAAVVSNPPSVGAIFSAVTNGFSPLTIVFTNTSSGSITNWVWNFGNGNIITNSSGADVTNTYTADGDYTVTLTVNGPGGSATVSQANYIVASPAPIISASLSGSNFVLSGTNCPAGVQYRILTLSNITQSTWTPVVTNTFLSNGTFSYTNPATNSQTYFQLVSP